MKNPTTDNPNAIDLFAGAGGLALGIHQAGFRTLGLLEFNRHACDTLRLNRDRFGVSAGGVLELDPRVVDFATISDHVDLLAAGAPCQPFSLGGKHRADSDGRNMFPEVFRAIRTLRPKVVMLENVRRLTRQSFKPYFDYILAQLESPHLAPKTGEDWLDHRDRLCAAASSIHELGDTYDVEWQLVNSADFGVPQKRERVIMIATRRDLGIDWSFPEPTHSEDALLYAQFVTGEYWREYGVPVQESEPRQRTRVARLREHPPTLPPWRTLRSVLVDLPEPVDGVPTSPWTLHVGIPGARVYKGHTGNHLDKPAKTIKAGDHGNPGGEHIVLKDDGSIRYLTVRECARVQTFPDWFEFSGSRTEAMRQIGNAVPVALAETVASSILAAFETSMAGRREEAGDGPLQAVAD